MLWQCVVRGTYAQIKVHILGSKHFTFPIQSQPSWELSNRANHFTRTIFPPLARRAFARQRDGRLTMSYFHDGEKSVDKIFGLNLVQKICKASDRNKYSAWKRFRRKSWKSVAVEPSRIPVSWQDFRQEFYVRSAFELYVWTHKGQDMYCGEPVGDLAKVIYLAARISPWLGILSRWPSLSTFTDTIRGTLRTHTLLEKSMENLPGVVWSVLFYIYICTN